MQKDTDLVLIAWGKRYDQAFMPNILPEPLRIARKPTCPHCGVFSYYCAGRVERHPVTNLYPADEWRTSVVGFVPASFRTSSSTIVGTVTILCPRCIFLFAYHVSEDSIRAYMDASPLWPKDVVVVRAEDSDEYRFRIDLLRKAAGLPEGTDHLEVLRVWDEIEKRDG